MGRKIKPNALRLGITTPWLSRWFYKKSLQFFLEEDCAIRDIIAKQLTHAGIAGVDIERTREDITIFIKSNRPGLVIGRRGKGVEDLRNKITKYIAELRKKRDISIPFHITVNVVELRRTELSAPVIADQIASDLERRLPPRLILKRQLRFIEQNREIQGAKIKLSGRLHGLSAAAYVQMQAIDCAQSPLRSNIDYGETIARTSYGVIGVKVWLYKGEIFEDDATAKETKI